MGVMEKRHVRVVSCEWQMSVVTFCRKLFDCRYLNSGRLSVFGRHVIALYQELERCQIEGDGQVALSNNHNFSIGRILLSQLWYAYLWTVSS